MSPIAEPLCPLSRSTVSITLFAVVVTPFATGGD